MPQSWTERWHNLDTHFLPPLHHIGNAVWGVTTVTQVRDPRHWVQWIWIESGYVWLLWTGGVLLLAAFVALVVVHSKEALRAAATRADEFGMVGIAAVASLATLCVVMVFDPHVTMRGTADVLYPVLAIAASAAAGVGRTPRSGQRADDRDRPARVLSHGATR
jgi:hypothetical protein